jgi:hypothetical protein
MANNQSFVFTLATGVLLSCFGCGDVSGSDGSELAEGEWTPSANVSAKPSKQCNSCDPNYARWSAGGEEWCMCSGSGSPGQVGQYSSLVSKHTGKCIDVQYSKVGNRVPIQQWTCNGSGAQKFISGANGSLRNRTTNQCIDVPGSSKKNGVATQQYNCNNTGAQNFRMERIGDHYRIVNANSGLCLDVSAWSKNDGARIVQWPCHNGANQLWSLR